MFTSPVNLGRGKQKGERVSLTMKFSLNPCLPGGFSAIPWDHASQLWERCISFSKAQALEPQSSQLTLASPSHHALRRCQGAPPSSCWEMEQPLSQASSFSTQVQSMGPLTHCQRVAASQLEGVVCEFTPYCLGVSSPGREWGPSGSENQCCLCRDVWTAILTRHKLLPSSLSLHVHLCKVRSGPGHLTQDCLPLPPPQDHLAIPGTQCL